MAHIFVTLRYRTRNKGCSRSRRWNESKNYEWTLRLHNIKHFVVGVCAWCVWQINDYYIMLNEKKQQNTNSHCAAYRKCGINILKIRRSKNKQNLVLGKKTARIWRIQAKSSRGKSNSLNRNLKYTLLIDAIEPKATLIKCVIPNDFVYFVILKQECQQIHFDKAQMHLIATMYLHKMMTHTHENFKFVLFNFLIKREKRAFSRSLLAND